MFKLLSIACTALAFAVPAAAQEAYSSRPIRIVVPYPPAAPPTTWRAPSANACRRRWASRW